MSGVLTALVAGSAIQANYALGDVEAGGAAECSLTLSRDGTFATTGNASIPSGDWIRPKSATIGDSYWVRLTKSTGTDPSPGTLGSWLQLSSARSWTWTQSGVGSKSFTGTLEFSTDSGGSTIVATGTVTATAAQVS